MLKLTLRLGDDIIRKQWEEESCVFPLKYGKSLIRTGTICIWTWVGVGSRFITCHISSYVHSVLLLTAEHTRPAVSDSTPTQTTNVSLELRRCF